jgi:hypothetical protein
MPKCPHCHEEINTLDHGVNANCIFTATLVKGRLDMGDEHGAPPYMVRSSMKLIPKRYPGWSYSTQRKSS